MSAHQVFRLRNPALLVALAAAFPVISYAAGAANVDFAVGNVTAVNAIGVQRPLIKGAEISSGDTIRTGDGGRAQVRFSDGAMVSLQPDTDFRVDNYQYSGKADGQEKGFFSLLKGGLRTITGLVGRTNRDNYKVTTSVATIGIRGTEFTAALGKSGGELVVNTGEGLVEVCNGAGCMLLASGESGIVTGSRAPSRTDSRPQLSPAQPGGTAQATFSTSENRGSNGMLLPVSAPLLSGDGYALSFVTKSSSPDTNSPGAAVFDSVSELQSFVKGSYDYAKISSVGSFTADGVIGWGRWTSVSSVSCGSLADMHYVVGIPTPMSDLTALGTQTLTYQMVGFTLPTGVDGTVGQAPSGSLTAQFNVGGTYMYVGVNMSVPIAGATYTMNGTSSMLANGSSFAFSPDASSSVSGFFAGAGASHAGLTYRIDTGGPVGGAVNGAAAFKR